MPLMDVLSIRARTLLALVLIVGSTTTAEAAAGRTPGAYSVSATGAAQYSIPLWTPPGVRGVQPNLALSYSSRGDNGYFGYGWRLKGLSAITRCNKTWAQDGVARNVRNDAVDRFCLGGNQLKLTAGTYGDGGAQYQTEIETFTRVTSYGAAGNGPAYFVAEQKSGLILEYGNTGDSRIESIGQSTVRVWALNKIRDRLGNEVLFSYTEDATNGSYRINTIQYTQNTNAGVSAHYQVAFIYEPVPTGEIDTAYLANSKIKRVVRVDRIDTFSDSVLVHRYDLSYESGLSNTGKSRLSSIQECAGTAGDCFPATTFTYQNGTVGLNTETATTYSMPLLTRPWAMDVNGDGRDDLVYPSSATSGSGTWRVAFANTAGSINAPVNTGVSNVNFGGAKPIDYNADGREDLLVPLAGGTWGIMLGSSSGLSAPTNLNIPVPVNGAGANVRAIDVDGDGYEDLVWADLYGYAGGDAIRYRLREPGGTFSSTVTTLVGPMPVDEIISKPFGPPGDPMKARVPDFNGDGRGDIAYQHIVRSQVDGPGSYNYFYAYSVLCPGASGLGFSLTASTGQAYYGDFNGDGLTDIWYPKGGTLGTVTVRLSTGTAFSGEITVSGLTSHSLPVVVLDWDGDGFDDILVRNTNTGNYDVSRSTGESFASPAGTGVSAADTDIAVADIDGNGIADLIYNTGEVIRYRTHPGSKPDLLLTATDGFGISTTFAYVPITQGSYSKDTSIAAATFPEQDFVAPIYVVSSATSSTGIAAPATYMQTFYYTSARRNLQGRGFAGFYERMVYDNRNSLFSHDYYNQVFPYVGFTTQSQQRQSDNSTLIARTVYTPAVSTFGSGNETRRFPYASPITSERYEVGGIRNATQISYQVINTGMDSYGNPQQITATTQDKDSLSPTFNQTWTTVTTNTTTNDSTNWCLGRPNQVTVQNTLPDSTTKTRTQGATIDYAACRVTQEILEPNSATLKVTTGYGFDTCGNINSVSVTGTKPDGTSMPTRTTSANFGSRCQFPESQTNALSQTSTLKYDYAMGVQTEIIDPNSIKTTFQYDVFGRNARENHADRTYTTWTYTDCQSSGTCIVGGHGLNVARLEYNSDDTLRSDGTILLDALDRALMVVDRSTSGYVRQDVRYNQLGLPAKSSAPCYWFENSADCTFWTNYTYDLIGRQTQSSRPVSDSDSTIQTTTTYYEGLTTRVVDAQGKQSTTVSTVLGQVARSADHDGYAQLFSYDPFGNVAQIQDSLGNILQTNIWNIRGVRIGSTDVDMGTWTYTPNSLGEILTQVDANAKTTTFTYDALSRLLTQSEPDGSATLTYTYIWGISDAGHNIGRLASQQIAGTSVLDNKQTFTYDEVGRLTQTKYSDLGAGLDYIVDQSYSSLTGLLDTLTYPTSTSGYRLKLQYEYANGYLVRISDFNVPANAFWRAYALDTFGNVTNEGLGNGLRTVRGFDAMTGWLDYIQTGPSGGTSIQNLSYLFDRVGNLIQRQDNRQTLTENFFYDNEYRLDYSTLNGTTNLDLAYNALGNISNKTGVGAYGYHASKIHAATTLGGAHSYQYDANGNTTSDPGLFTLDHYTSGFPKTANWVAGGFSSTFQLDPDGQRFQQVAAYPGGSDSITYIGGLVDKEVSGSVTTWKHYIFAPTGRVALYTRKSSGTPASATYYFTRDHLDSIDSITDAAGAVQVRLSYDAFGARRMEAGWSGATPDADWTKIYAITHRGFTDHEMLDDIDLIHMNGRLFDPQSGQFSSADPLIPDFGNTQAFNRYSYVFNNALSFTDPTGFDVNYQAINVGLGEVTVSAAAMRGGGASMSLGSASVGGGAASGGRGGRSGRSGGAGNEAGGGPQGGNDGKDGKNGKDGEDDDPLLPNARTLTGIGYSGRTSSASGGGYTSAPQVQQEVCQSLGYMYCSPTSPGIASAIADAEGNYAVIGASMLLPQVGGEALLAARSMRAVQAARGATTVYRSVAAGEVNYVGITNNLARRAAEQLSSKGIQIEKLMGGLSRSDARAVEQALIEIHGLGKNGGTLLNRINSISPLSPAYTEQLRRGYQLLRTIGY
jgi:RHS repeat-associated protein